MKSTPFEIFEAKHDDLTMRPTQRRETLVSLSQVVIFSGSVDDLPHILIEEVDIQRSLNPTSNPTHD